MRLEKECTLIFQLELEDWNPCHGDRCHSHPLVVTAKSVSVRSYNDMC